MLPTTPQFFCFLLVLFVAYWLTRRVRLAPVLLIGAANLFFYAKWGWIYPALIPAAAACDFMVGRLLANSRNILTRRLLITASIGMNIGLIVICRYVPFFTGSGWVLPLSLSFYAFQAMSYTIDIYRGEIKPTANFFTYFASVNFFPTVLAGPITRVAALVPQWTKKAEALAPEEGSRAFFLIGLGLAKKFLIADYLGTNLINRVFDLPALYSGGDVLVAVYGYALQLYYDFSGYTDIAIGSALLLGIKLPANFNAPYSARNIADFWKRWHITLSKWLTEYLFFSLPGKRSKWGPYVNSIITMTIGGIWHGANWTFLIWGLLHGCGLAFFRGWQAWRGRRQAALPWWQTVLSVALTFHFVLFAWIFFRAASVHTAVTILKQIGTFPYAFDNTTGPFLMVLMIGALAHFVPQNWYEFLLDGFARFPATVQAVGLALLLVAIQYVGATGAAPFIYTKF